MKTDPRIAPKIFSEVHEHLQKIEAEYNVVILHCIESGSRAWGFPSPDSDYDVRFIYAHASEWYIQLAEESDVIELPIDDDLDIAGWDIRKALRLANKGNVVIQEWINSPIVYKQSIQQREQYEMVSKAFNAISAFHHYRSMAKKAFSDLSSLESKKLKRFFYFARATLSAKWILVKGTMPSIVFADLVEEVVNETAMSARINALVEQKSKESEVSTLQVPTDVYELFVELYHSIADAEQPSAESSQAITNNDFRSIFSSSDTL